MEKRPDIIYVFGPFRFDTAERILMYEQMRFQLAPKLYAVLLALLENAGNIVKKEELITRCWPGLFVTDSCLQSCISDLRNIFKQCDPGRNYIKTVSKVGYRFEAKLKEVKKEAVTEISYTRVELAEVLLFPSEDLVTGKFAHLLSWLGSG